MDFAFHWFVSAGISITSEAHTLCQGALFSVWPTRSGFRGSFWLSGQTWASALSAPLFSHSQVLLWRRNSWEFPVSGISWERVQGAVCATRIRPRRWVWTHPWPHGSLVTLGLMALWGALSQKLVCVLWPLLLCGRWHTSKSGCNSHELKLCVCH